MFSSKIKLKHFIEQVKKASKHFEENNPPGAAPLIIAVDAWEGKHDDSDVKEYHHLGFLVCELLAHTIEHWQEREQIVRDELEDLRENLEEALADEETLRDTLQEIKDSLHRL